MLKDKIITLFKTFFVLSLILFAGCRTASQGDFAAAEPAVPGQYDNLSFGVPGKADTVIDRPGYALGYSEYHEQAVWVIYVMTGDEAAAGAVPRADRFRSDPDIPTGSASPGDYTRSGYDRGHLAPAADMAFSARTMSDSFFMSNMSPQKPAFNRGVWKKLEASVRNFAIAEQTIVVATGPVLPAVKKSYIGRSRVTVPAYYYKVVFDLTPPRKMIGFILPNAGSRKSPAAFAVSVDEVERVTGLDFFSALPDEEEERLERTFSPGAWRGLQR